MILAAEILVALMDGLYGVGAGWILILWPIIVLPLGIALTGLARPEVLKTSAWMRWTLHGTSILNALIVFAVVAVLVWTGWLPPLMD